MAQFAAQKDALDRSNQWAETQNRELQANRARIAELQDELSQEQHNATQMAADYESKISSLEQDLGEKTKWARDVDTTSASKPPTWSRPSTRCTTPKPSSKNVRPGRCDCNRSPKL